MKHRIAYLVIIALFLSVGTGCEKIGKVKNLANRASKAMEQAQAAKDPEQAGQKMGEAFSGFRKLVGGGEAVRAVDFRKLKTVLPEEVAGLKRVDARGERGTRMGISTSKIEGEYRTEDGGQHASITIEDMGSMRGLGMLANDLKSLGASVDKASDTGYERSVEYEGYDAVEKYRKTQYSEHGSISLLVAERFNLTVEGSGVPMETIKAVLDGVDLDALEGMKDEGVGVDDGTEQRVAEMYEKARRSEMEAAQESETGEEPSAPVQAVEAEALEAFLPEAMAGLSRTDVSSQRNTMGEAYTIAISEGRYEVEGEASTRLTVKITDFAGAVGPGGMLPGYTWLLMDIDRESSTGYERTTEYRGYPTYEKLTKRGRTTTAEVDVIVADRFAVTIDGRGVSMETVKAALDQLDLRQLEQLKKASV